MLWVGALYLFVRANSGDPGPDLGAGTLSPGASFPAEGTGVAGASPSASPSSAPGTAVVTATLPDTTLTMTAPGGIAVQGLAPHHLVIRVSAPGAITRVGYLVPTSLDHSTADMRNVPAPLTVRTDVYGKPAYAEVFVQTGRGGTPITCTIEVDGTVTSTKTTSGAYGRQVCIG